MSLLDFFKRKDTGETPVSSPPQSASYPSSSSISTYSLPHNIQEIVDLAKLGLTGARTGDSRLERTSLINMYNLVQSSCSQLLKVPAEQCNTVGSGFALLLSYRQVRESEDRARAIADYAFYCFSKAIEENPHNEMLHVKRLSVLAETRDFFYYTIANALELPDNDNPFSSFSRIPLQIRTNDYLYAMVKYELTFMDNKRYNGPIGELINATINARLNKTASDGKQYIDSVVSYLENTFRKY